MPLRAAIAKAALKGEAYRFILNYQPILPVSARIGDEAGWYEALLRVRPIRGEDLRPAEFMPIDTPENVALLAAIDFWVLHRVAGLLYRRGEKFSVNFSRYLLSDPLIEQRLQILVNGYGDRLSLEVSEAYEWSPFEQERLDMLSLYVRLSLDDVGAGRLEYLHSLPLSGFKIDGSLILPVLESSKAQEIVRMLLKLSVEFNLTVVAEFVASADIWDWLREESSKIDGLQLFVQGHAVAGYREF
jgi:EAL domain-containing protein (putative c-di-GMP-specific phosphodiesterase class I)